MDLAGRRDLDATRRYDREVCDRLQPPAAAAGGGGGGGRGVRERVSETARQELERGSGNAVAAARRVLERVRSEHSARDRKAADHFAKISLFFNRRARGKGGSQ